MVISTSIRQMPLLEQIVAAEMIAQTPIHGST